MRPKFRVVDARGDEPIIADVVEIQFETEQIAYWNEYHELEWIDFDEAELLQFTGLHDWYAGDIIQKGEIIRAITADWEHGLRFMLGKHILCKQDALNGTKIGSIHEKPELLEVKE